MKLNRIKIFVIAIIALPVFAIAVFNTNQVTAVETTAQDAVAEQYKKQCALCHKPKAEKFFDPAEKDEVLIEITLKGKKAEKPPHMPGYEEKGMTKEQAKALIDYMRKLRTPDE